MPCKYNLYVLYCQTELISFAFQDGWYIKESKKDCKFSFNNLSFQNIRYILFAQNHDFENFE